MQIAVAVIARPESPTLDACLAALRDAGAAADGGRDRLRRGRDGAQPRAGGVPRRRCWRSWRTTSRCGEGWLRRAAGGLGAGGGRRRGDRRARCARAFSASARAGSAPGLDGRARPCSTSAPSRSTSTSPTRTLHGGNVSFRADALRGAGGFWPARGHADGRDWFSDEHHAQHALGGAGLARALRARGGRRAARDRRAAGAGTRRAPAAALRRAPGRRGRRAAGDATAARALASSGAGALLRARPRADAHGARGARGREPRRARRRPARARATSSRSRRARRSGRRCRRPRARRARGRGRAARSSCSTTAWPTRGRPARAVRLAARASTQQLDVLARDAAGRRRSRSSRRARAGHRGASRSTTATATTRRSPRRRSPRAGCRGRCSRRTGHVERGARVLVGRGHARSAAARPQAAARARARRCPAGAGPGASGARDGASGRGTPARGAAGARSRRDRRGRWTPARSGRAPTPQRDGPPRPMTRRTSCARSPRAGVAIGAHTRTHRGLAYASRGGAARRDRAAAATTSSAGSGTPPTAFAYPFGVPGADLDAADDGHRPRGRLRCAVVNAPGAGDGRAAIAFALPRAAVARPRRRRVRPLAGRARALSRATRPAGPDLHCAPMSAVHPAARSVTPRRARARASLARVRAMPAAPGDPARRRGGARHCVGGGDRAVERPRRGGALRLRRAPRADRARPAAQRGRRLPVHGAEPRAVQAEPLPHPPAARPGSRPTARSTRTERELGRLPDSAYKNGSGPSSAAHYPPLYYAYEAVVYKLTPSHSELTRLFVMRLATVLLFVVTVALTWLIATELLAVDVGAGAGHRAGGAAAQARVRRGHREPRPHARRAVDRRAAGGVADGPPRTARTIGDRAGRLRVRRGAHTSAWLLPRSPSPSSRWRSPPGVFARPCGRRSRWAAGALGIMVLSVAIALLWVRGHTHGAAGAAAAATRP